MASPVLNDQDHQLAARLSNLPGPKANTDAARAIDGGAFYLTHASSGYGVGKVLELGASGFTATLTAGSALRVMITALDDTVGYAVVTKGLVQGLSSLTTGAYYYVNSSGALTTTAQAVGAGYALSSTSLLFDGMTEPPGGAALPIGGIIPFGGWQLPANYFWCDGAAYGSSVLSGYRDLAAVLGGAFGTTNTFLVSTTNGSSTVTCGWTTNVAVGDVMFPSEANYSVTMEDYPGLAASSVPVFVVEVVSNTAFRVSSTLGGTPIVFLTNSPSATWYRSFRVPDLRGRVLAGRDDLGGSAASRLTTATGGFGEAVITGAAGGTENHLLLSTESGMPAHSHSYVDRYRDANNNFANGTNTRNGGSLTSGNFTTGANTAANAANAHPNCQPTIVGNYIIRVR